MTANHAMKTDLANFRRVVVDLSEAFSGIYPQIISQGLNEANLRISYLDPLFEGLGWDIRNSQHAPLHSRGVVVEPPGQAGKKRPDYLFRVGGVDKFICEAKRPRTHIDKAGFQTQNYVYNMRLWVGLLSDFEFLILYVVGGQPSKERPFDPVPGWRLHYRDYEANSQKIWDLLSQEAVSSGSLERLAQSLEKVPRRAAHGWLLKPDRTRTVDNDFLSYLELQRQKLAPKLHDANPLGPEKREREWSGRELNEATQTIIDRILFQRISEDRHIAVGRSLRSSYEEWERDGRHKAALWPLLVQNFRHLHRAFNGGLYGRTGDQPHFSDHLNVPDEWLSDFIETLTADDCQYLFSFIPVEILGSVYERFLASVVLPSGKVEQKPEVRKAGGVYYTPEPVVHLIVEKAVRPLLAGRTPSEIAKLKILDPACGSGSFLIRAFELICEYHIEWLMQHPNAQDKNYCYVDNQNNLHLTTGFKRTILKNNIFGVDLDPQAVEVTEMSLYLKVLEGETTETLERDHRLFPRDTYLPDLSSNIKWGNTLVTADIHGDFRRLQELRAFDWRENFSFLKRSGGFDAVIGNPPYILLQDEFRDDEVLTYYRARYAVASYKIDTYHLFIEAGIKLTRPTGYCSMIVPSNFLTNNHLAELRRFLLSSSTIEEIYVIDENVFHSVSVNSAIFVVKKHVGPLDTFDLIHAMIGDAKVQETRRERLSRTSILSNDHALFTGSTGDEIKSVVAKMKRHGVALGTLAFVNFGKQLRDRAKYTKDVIDAADDRFSEKSYYRCYTGRDVTRYLVKWGGLACLKSTAARRGGCWDNAKHDAVGKLLTRQIGRYPTFAMDELGYQCLNTIFMINPRDSDHHPNFLLGVLNSSLLRAYWLDQYYDRRRTFPKIKGTYLKQLPVPRPILSNVRERGGYEKIVTLVQRIADAHKELDAALSHSEKRPIEKLILGAESQIDEYVAEMFGLTPAEIEAVHRFLGQSESEPS